RGDIESAQRYFAVARPDIEKRVSDNPDIAEHHSQLGLLYAFMRRKEDASREGRRAFELEPESQDAFHGAIGAANLALVYALVRRSQTKQCLQSGCPLRRRRVVAHSARPDPVDATAAQGASTAPCAVVEGCSAAF